MLPYLGNTIILLSQRFLLGFTYARVLGGLRVMKPGPVHYLLLVVNGRVSASIPRGLTLGEG